PPLPGAAAVAQGGGGLWQLAAARGASARGHAGRAGPAAVHRGGPVPEDRNFAEGGRVCARVDSQEPGPPPLCPAGAAAAATDIGVTFGALPAAPAGQAVEGVSCSRWGSPARGAGGWSLESVSPSSGEVDIKARLIRELADGLAEAEADHGRARAAQPPVAGGARGDCSLGLAAPPAEPRMQPRRVACGSPRGGGGSAGAVAGALAAALGGHAARKALESAAPAAVPTPLRSPRALGRALLGEACAG
ncbi:unnamed protein product, partial [Prorocentrum cordatum]